MVELRLRTKIAPTELESKVGKILTSADFNVMLTGPSLVRKPDGRHLCVYVPGGLGDVAPFYPTLSKIRGKTDNRQLASGSTMARFGPGGTQARAMPVMSSILGAVDPSPRHHYCRLTSFTAKQVGTWESLTPLWATIAEQLAQCVPDRYAAQAKEAERTHSEWVIPGTPFTTITVNNSYSTGVHTDKGDLDAGFSCLGVIRRGNYTSGHLVFPEYRVAVDMQDGDLLLMDAHEFHGNTQMACACGARLLNEPCKTCGAERISVVCYFRTRMVECGSPAEEQAKHLEVAQRREAAKASA